MSKNSNILVGLSAAIIGAIILFKKKNPTGVIEPNEQTRKECGGIAKVIVYDLYNPGSDIVVYDVRGGIIKPIIHYYHADGTDFWTIDRSFIKIILRQAKQDGGEIIYEKPTDEAMSEYENLSNMVSGIGAVRRSKRRIWSEVEQAQKHGIDLTDPDAWKNHTDTLSWMAQGKIKDGASDKPIEQRYFNQLQRAYKSIAGTNLPYTENVVRNENDDVILIYRDYQLDKLPAKAAEYMYDQAIENMHNDPETSAYWATIAMIANGDLKFVWCSTKDNVHRGAEKLVFGKSAPEERKRRISYLASPAKGGRYPEEYAHQLWERTGADTDDQSITNGVLAAIRDIDTKGSAAEYCKREYLQAFQVEEPLLYQDVPF